MEEDVLNALLTRAAYLPGGFDRQGRILIIVNIISDSQLWNKTCLETCISYIKRLLSPDLLKKGVTILVDAQRCSSRITRSHSRTIYCLFDDISVNILLVRSEGFWEKHVEPCAKSQSKEEPVFVSRSRLSKYIDSLNLPEDLGGTLMYNHDHWVQNRKAIDDFRKLFDYTIGEIENLHILLLESKAVRPSDVDQEFNRCGMCYTQVQSHIAEAVDAGNRLLTRIADCYRLLAPVTAASFEQQCPMSAGLVTNLPSTPSNTSDSPKLPFDMVNEKSRTEQMLSDIQKKQSDIRSAWRDLEQSVHETREVGVLEEGVAFVTNWILNTAEQMLNRKQAIGCDVKACEDLRREHESLEMKCRETYGFYAELLYKIDTYSKTKETSSLAYKDLMSQRDFMNFVCRSFATRLERRRNILIKSLRFYRLITDYFDRTTSVFESLVMGNRIEDLEAAAGTLQKLRDSQMDLEALENELVKEGEKLSDMLSMPVKDAMGRDLRIDYSEDIANIRDILDTTIARRNIFIDSLELQKLTLEQVTHIHTYEVDARIAIKWMDDLYNVMIRCHSHVGCNVHEIQVQKDELQTFQETGKSIYQYGCQLLEASHALRTSCKLDTEAAKTMSNQLRCTWHNLQTISQEHMTRLRVSAVFHRSVDEYCNKLHDLKISVCSLGEIDEPDCRRSRLRKYLVLREGLLVEVGRMVRLGRLLKTRLREPFILDDVESGGTAISHNSVNGARDEDDITSATLVYPTGKNEMALNAITNRLTEIAEVAEALDATLKDSQNGLDLIEMNPSPGEKKNENNQPIQLSQQYSHASANAEDWQSRSIEDESFATASEGYTTPRSHSSSFQTASEGRTPSYLSSGKTSFDSSDFEDATSQILSPGNISFDGSSEPSFVSAQQSLTTSPQSMPADSGIECASDYKSLATGKRIPIDCGEDEDESHSRSVTPTPENTSTCNGIPRTITDEHVPQKPTSINADHHHRSNDEVSASVCSSAKLSDPWRTRYCRHVTKQTIKGCL